MFEERRIAHGLFLLAVTTYVLSFPVYMFIGSGVFVWFLKRKYGSGHILVPDPVSFVLGAVLMWPLIVTTEL